MTEDWQNGGFALYVHWPFCQSKCPYCDFNSHVAAGVDQTAWRNALVAEVRRHATLVPDRVLTSIFFGGGTPSLMPPQTVAAIIETARACWPAANDLEITLEANPTSVEAGRFRDYRAAGVSRISMGIQSLNDTHLKALGRLHTAAEARAAFAIARDTFDSVSFDLIYARQGQSLSEWSSELHEALEMAVDHLSLYQLTIEPGTAFGDRAARGSLRGLPSEDLSADLYELTQEVCGTAGLLGYEVSNHARPGAHCRHNLVYWRYGDYVGVGPGAHGRLTVGGRRLATEAIRQPDAWLSAATHGTAQADVHESLNVQDQATEMVLMGLRLSEGISVTRYAQMTGRTFRSDTLGKLSADGLIVVERNRLSVTAKGRPILNAILRALLDD